MLLALPFSAVPLGKITGPYGPSTWYQANDTCEQQGLKLLTIDSQEEENYVNGTLNPGFEYVNELFEYLNKCLHMWNKKAKFIFLYKE